MPALPGTPPRPGHRPLTWPPSSAGSSSPQDFRHLAPASQPPKKSTSFAWPGKTSRRNRESPAPGRGDRDISHSRPPVREHPHQPVTDPGAATERREVHFTGARPRDALVPGVQQRLEQSARPASGMHEAAPVRYRTRRRARPAGRIWPAAALAGVSGLRISLGPWACPTGTSARAAPRCQDRHPYGTKGPGRPGRTVLAFLIGGEDSGPGFEKASGQRGVPRGSLACGCSRTAAR